MFVLVFEIFNLNQGENLDLPTDIFSNLKSSYKQVTSSSSSKKKSSTGYNLLSKDFRFGPLTIESVEMSADADLSQISFPLIKTSKPHVQTTSGYFAAFKCGTTELNFGILHLYRDLNEVDDIMNNSNYNEPGPQYTSDEKKQLKGSGLILAVLAVPSYMTTQDFLNFIGAVTSMVSNFRIIRDSFPNRYIVLMKFRERADADLVYEQFNGLNFNSMQEEQCHIVYIKSVEFKSHAIPPYAFPPHQDVPSSLFFGSKFSNSEVESNQIPLAPHNLIELPTCPVCLDRMDASVTSLLTIICHHTFHSQCLKKWGDSSCPVCRYSTKSLQEEIQNECDTCRVQENLWICLLCGHVGCGRYVKGHAYAHFNETSHLYALELETQRVWDYAGDGYVHRLIQNLEGKIVELEAPANSRGPVPDLLEHGKGNSYVEDESGITQKKLDHISLEYTYLLTSQLESQRLYYESQLSKFQSVLTSQLDEVSEQVAQLALERDESKALYEKINESIPVLNKEKSSLERKLKVLTEKLVNLEKEYREEKALNLSLMENQFSLKDIIGSRDDLLKQKDKEIFELQEQIRDLMFFLEAGQKIKVLSPEEQQELKDGVVSVDTTVNNSTTSNSSSKKKKSRGKR
ncbi:hypothetical protein HDU92_005079 [Lobulomyces angularis]|nr:hypothetical protein HDU92_005079 [Lobulomyces angularis]